MFSCLISKPKMRVLFITPFRFNKKTALISCCLILGIQLVKQTSTTTMFGCLILKPEMRLLISPCRVLNEIQLSLVVAPSHSKDGDTAGQI